MTDKTVDVAADSPPEFMAGELLKALVDELRVAGASWQQLSKSQQDSVIERLRWRIRNLTEEAIVRIQAGAYEHARVKIESVTVKKGAKAALELAHDQVHQVIDYVNQRCVLVLCDPDQFFGGIDDVEGEDNQRKLDLDNDKADGPEQPDED